MRTVLTTLLLAFLLISTTAAQPGPPDHARPIEGVILIKFAPDALKTPPQQLRPNELGLQGQQAARLRQLLNARSGPGQKLFRTFAPADTLGRHRQTNERVRLKDLSRWYRFPVRDTTDVEALAARLRELPVVLKATPDYNASLDRRSPESVPAPPRTEPNDPKFPDQWGYDDSDDTDVDAPEAWSLQTGRSDVTVAVVDDGVDLDHPDLDPGDRSRVIQGYDFGDDDSNPGDDGSHGTPVAGTIGARTDNNEGVAGLMWDLQIMPLKYTTNSGGYPFSAAAEAFDYARVNGADIINYSSSSTSPSSDGVVAEAVYNAYASGMLFVGSSGNDFKNSVNYPAALHTAIGVGATDRSDQRHGYSNYGPSLDIVAPSGFETTARFGSYLEFGGTSQAAPVVSGIAGLILSESRDEGHNLSNNDIVHLLERTAETVPDMNGQDFTYEHGHGRVNAYEALRRLNDPFEVSHGTASFTKIYDDDNVSFVNGFVKENGVSYGAGTYICDIYELSASASSPDFYYEETPWFWLPVTEPGFSAANPNDGDRYLSKSVSKSSAQATTYFYYVESNVNGQEIGWVPFDPTVHKRGGTFEYTVIGEPGTPPLSTTLSGPSSLDSGSKGTWTANSTGGSGTLSHTWEYREPGSFTWLPASCSGSSCTLRLFNDAGFYQQAAVKVSISRGTEEVTAMQEVSVKGSCSFNCPLATADTFELQKPNVEVNGKQVHVRWKTPGRLRSDVAIEHRAGNKGSWAVLDAAYADSLLHSEEAGAFTYQYTTPELDVGPHQFRLSLSPRGTKQGKSERHSQTVSARILLDDSYQLKTYPNPVRESATIQLAVKKKQNVSIRVFDLLGRQVATVHEGQLAAQQTRTFNIGERQLPVASGTYFIRVTGETFVATDRIAVVR